MMNISTIIIFIQTFLQFIFMLVALIMTLTKKYRTATALMIVSLVLYFLQNWNTFYSLFMIITNN